MSDPKKDDPAGGSGMIMLTPAEMHDIIQTTRHRTAVLCAIIEDRNVEIEAIAQHLAKQTFFDADGKQVWPEQDLKKRLHMAGVVSNSEKNIVTRLSTDVVVDALVSLYIMAMTKPALASQPLVYMFFEGGSFAASEMTRISNELFQKREQDGTNTEDHAMVVTSDIPMEDGVAVKVAILTAKYAIELAKEFALRCDFNPDMGDPNLRYNVGADAATIIGLTHFGFSINEYDVPVVAMARSRVMAKSSSSGPAAEA